MMTLSLPGKKTEPAQAIAQGLPTQSIQLSVAQAARWLNALEQGIASEAQGSDSLEKLRDQLEDACWLARWKREDVILDFCPSFLPNLFRELLQLGQCYQTSEEFDVLEQMIAVLSVDDKG